MAAAFDPKASAESSSSAPEARVQVGVNCAAHALDDHHVCTRCSCSKFSSDSAQVEARGPLTVAHYVETSLAGASAAVAWIPLN